VKIIAGAWRGRPLFAPPGRDTRPTSARTREGLFSMLVSRLGSFEGLTVADLFAGTGALGLEALSRGAARCIFVERERAALDKLQRNIAMLDAAEQAEVIAQGVEHVRSPARPCDLILIDAPYGIGLAQMALDRIGAGGWLAPGGWISVESGGESLSFPAALTPDAERRFGKAVITLASAS